MRWLQLFKLKLRKLSHCISVVATLNLLSCYLWVQVLVLVGALSEDVGDGAPPLSSASAGASSANGGASSVKTSLSGTSRSGLKLKSWRGRGVSDEALLVALHDAHALGLWSGSSAHSASSTASHVSSSFSSSSSASGVAGGKLHIKRNSSHSSPGSGGGTTPPAGVRLSLGRGVAVVPTALLEAHSSLQAQGLLEYRSSAPSGVGAQDDEFNRNENSERAGNDRKNGCSGTTKRVHETGSGLQEAIGSFTTAFVSAFERSGSNSRGASSAQIGGDYRAVGDDYCDDDWKEGEERSSGCLNGSGSGGRSYLTSPGGELLMALALRGPWVAETLSSLMLGLPPAERHSTLNSSNGNKNISTSSATSKSGTSSSGGVFLAGLPPRALLGSLCLYFDATSLCYVVCASSRSVSSLDPTALRRRRILGRLESAAAGSKMCQSADQSCAAAEDPSMAASRNSDDTAEDGIGGANSSTKFNDKTARLPATTKPKTLEEAHDRAWLTWDSSAAATINCRPARVCGASMPLPLPWPNSSNLPSASASHMPAKSPPMTSTRSSNGSRSSTLSHGPGLGDSSEEQGKSSVELEAVVLHYQLASSVNSGSSSCQLASWAREHARFRASDDLPALAFSAAPLTTATATNASASHRSTTADRGALPSFGGPLGPGWSSNMCSGLGMGSATVALATTTSAPKMGQATSGAGSLQAGISSNSNNRSLWSGQWQVESALDGAVVGASTALPLSESGFVSRGDASNRSSADVPVPAGATVVSAATTGAAIAAIACRGGPALWPLLDAASKRTLRSSSGAEAAQVNQSNGGLPVFGGGDGVTALAPLLRWRPSFTVARVVARVNANGTSNNRENKTADHIATISPVAISSTKRQLSSSTPPVSTSSHEMTTWATALTQDPNLMAALDAWHFETSSIGYAGLKLGSVSHNNGSSISSSDGNGNHNGRSGSTSGNMAEKSTLPGKCLSAVEIPGGGALLLGSSGCLVLRPPPPPSPSSLSNPSGTASSSAHDSSRNNSDNNLRTSSLSPLPRSITRLLVAYGGHTSRTALLKTLEYTARATADRAARTVAATNERAPMTSSRQELKSSSISSSAVLCFPEGGAPSNALSPPPTHIYNDSLPLPALPPPWIAGIMAAGTVFTVFAVFRWSAAIFTEEGSTSFWTFASFCFHALRVVIAAGAAVVATSAAHTACAAATAHNSSSKSQPKPLPEVVGRPTRLTCGAPFATASSVLACAASLRDALDQLTPVNSVSGDSVGNGHSNEGGVDGCSSANKDNDDEDASDEGEDCWPFSDAEVASKAESSSSSRVPISSVNLGISGMPVVIGSNNNSSSNKCSNDRNSRSRPSRRRWAAAEATLKALVEKEARDEALVTEAAERAVSAAERWAAATAAALNASQQEFHPEFKESSSGSDAHYSLPGAVGAWAGTVLGTLLLRWPNVAATWFKATVQFVLAGNLFSSNLRHSSGRKGSGGSSNGTASLASKKNSQPKPRAEHLSGKKGAGSAAGGGAAVGDSLVGRIGGSLARDVWDLVVEVGFPFAQVEVKKLLAKVKPRTRLDACAWAAAALAVAVTAIGSGLFFTRVAWHVARALLWWW